MTKGRRRGIPPIFTLIGQRAALIANRSRVEFDPVVCAIVVMSVAEKFQLRLDELLEADEGNFAHDVFGMMRHYDIATGTMRDCFSPRFERRN
jgi:hypothetical protein